MKNIYILIFAFIISFGLLLCTHHLMLKERTAIKLIKQFELPLELIIFDWIIKVLASEG